VGGDHLVVLDSCSAERLLYTATRMYPRAAVITVTNEQRRGFGHLVLRFTGSGGSLTSWGGKAEIGERVLPVQPIDDPRHLAVADVE
jgi:hypothetical protein